MATTVREMLINSGSWQAYSPDHIVTYPGSVQIRKSDPDKPGVYFYSTAQTVVAAPEVGIFGKNASVDEGTSADIFVSLTGDDTTGTGEVGAPYRTITKAVSMLGSGKRVIALRGGDYRESVSLGGRSGTEAAPIIIKRYGTEPARISGLEPVASWAVCTSGDIDRVGEHYASIYKATVATSIFPSSAPIAANLHENGKRLYMAAGQVPFPSRPWSPYALVDWLVAQETITDAGKITGHRVPAITSKYTAAQIGRCTVQYHIAPNAAGVSAVESVTGDVITLADKTRTYESNANKDKVAYLNLLPAMKQGQWGYVENGDGTTTLYVWPRNVANLDKIEVASRSVGINLAGSNHVHLRSVDFIGQASNGAATDGLYAITANNSHGGPKFEGNSVLNCAIIQTWRNEAGYSPIFFRASDDFRIINCSIIEAIGQFGIFPFGAAASKNDGVVIHRCLIDRSDKAPVRIYGAQNTRVSRNLFLSAGLAAHSNKGNVYEGGSNVLWHGNCWVACDGYLTWQEASGIHIGMNFVPGGYAGSARAIQDQNHGNPADPASQAPATQIGVDEIAYIFNNATPPHPTGVTYANSIDAGDYQDPNAKFHVANNIFHGMVFQTDYITANSHNATTAGTTMSGTDQIFALADVWEDITGGNLALKASSPTHAMASRDLTDVLAILQAKFPDYGELYQDLAGNAFDPDAPPIGPYLPGSAPIPHRPIWVDIPTLGGAAIVGGSMYFTRGYVVGSPYPTITRRVMVSFDNWETWDYLDGLDAPGFTVPDEAGGGMIGCEFDAGGEIVRVTDTRVVAEGYPISTPEVLGQYRLPNTANVPSVTTSALPVSDKPMLMALATRNASSANLTPVLTASNGTWTRVAGMIRTNMELNIYLCTDAAPGTVTFGVTGALSMASAEVTVLEVEGLAGIGATATNGGTNIFTMTSSLTTTAPEGGVLHFHLRQFGTAGNPLVMTGVETELWNGGTAEAATGGNISLACGYERAQTVAAYTAVGTWPIARTAQWFAVEMKSV